jgi:hypothetical protein
MADAALFVGWSFPRAGREQVSTQVFGEAIAYYNQLRDQGEIEGFDAVFLEPHGGDLGGFFLVRGDQEALARVRISDEFVRLNLRAQLVVENFGVVGATTGDAIQSQMALFQEQVGDLT